MVYRQYWLSPYSPLECAYPLLSAPGDNERNSRAAVAGNDNTLAARYPCLFPMLPVGRRAAANGFVPRGIQRTGGGLTLWPAAPSPVAHRGSTAPEPGKIPKSILRRGLGSPREIYTGPLRPRIDFSSSEVEDFEPFSSRAAAQPPPASRSGHPTLSAGHPSCTICLLKSIGFSASRERERISLSNCKNES